MPPNSVSKNQVSRRQVLGWLAVGSATALLPEMPLSQLELPPAAAATTSPVATCVPILHPIVSTDDDRTVLFFIKMFLEQLGSFQVISTPWADEVLSICQSQEVSLVISDIKRPDMDGRELLRRLRANPTTTHIPLMLCTAGWLEPWEEAELNLDGFLFKPFEPEELVATVQQVLEKQGHLLPPTQSIEMLKFTNLP